jgi:DNA-binding TFAR19-related protein (PDSD5 family)
MSPRDYHNEIVNISDALAETSIVMPDEDISMEAVEDGEDLQLAAEEVKDVLRGSLKAFKQRRLIEAQQQYESKMSAMFQGEHCLPETPEERRALLHSFLNTNPQVSNAILTMQHREFTGLTDEDVESYLRQFMELGFLKG